MYGLIGDDIAYARGPNARSINHIGPVTSGDPSIMVALGYLARFMLILPKQVIDLLSRIKNNLFIPLNDPANTFNTLSTPLNNLLHPPETGHGRGDDRADGKHEPRGGRVRLRRGTLIV